MEDQSFSAHRVVLAATIPYFHAMFLNNMVESKLSEITLQGFESMYNILQFIRKIKHYQ